MTRRGYVLGGMSRLARIRRAFYIKYNAVIIIQTIIEAPSSTKNEDKSRDPEMHSTKKGNQYYFGEKAHIGVDAYSGIIHSVAVTPANISDINMTDELIRKDDKFVFGDSGYRGISKRTKHKNISFIISMMRGKLKKIEWSYLAAIERCKSGIRAKVEFPFRVLKNIFHYRNVRYKGLRKKNEEAMYMKCGLINLYQCSNKLLLRA